MTTDPGKILTLTAIASALTALTIVGLALAPNVWFAIAMSVLFTIPSSIIVPGIYAVLSLTMAMAADHVGEGIRVNCVCPGTVDTPWVGRLLAAADDPDEARRNLVARQPVGRLGTAEEIAEAIVYLASPAAGYVTGAALAIDGGTAGFRVPTCMCS